MSLKRNDCLQIAKEEESTFESDDFSFVETDQNTVNPTIAIAYN